MDGPLKVSEMAIVELQKLKEQNYPNLRDVTYMRVFLRFSIILKIPIGIKIYILL
jgi:hypothetical protein